MSRRALKFLRMLLKMWKISWRVVKTLLEPYTILEFSWCKETFTTSVLMIITYCANSRWWCRISYITLTSRKSRPSFISTDTEILVRAGATYVFVTSRHTSVWRGFQENVITSFILNVWRCGWRWRLNVPRAKRITWAMNIRILVWNL